MTSRLQGSLVVVVEVLQGLAGGEPGGPDAALPAVGLPGGHLALQAGGQELLVAPGLGPGPLGQPGHRVAQRRGLQRPGQVGELGGQVPAARRSRGGHHAASCPGAARRAGVESGDPPPARRAAWASGTAVACPPGSGQRDGRASGPVCGPRSAVKTRTGRPLTARPPVTQRQGGAGLSARTALVPSAAARRATRPARRAGGPRRCSQTWMVIWPSSQVTDSPAERRLLDQRRRRPASPRRSTAQSPMAGYALVHHATPSPVPVHSAS